MSTTSLFNRQVEVTISDPWEFGTECGTGPFIGTVVDLAAETIVIALQQSIGYQGRNLFMIIARPRHADGMPAIVLLQPMPANLMLLPLEICKAADLRPTLTKDGVAAIGTIRLSP